MKLLAFLRTFQREVSGAIAPLTVLLMIPILGATALAVDGGYWYFKQRDMQNAADSAALAAAQTADDGATDDFINVAKGTAAKYGYVDGEANVVVTPSRVDCPGATVGTLECKQVQIDYDSPLFFSPIVGFSGNKSGGSRQGVVALSIAGEQTGGGQVHKFCMYSKETTPGVDGILAHGVPFANLNGCDIYSNSDLSCTGHNLNAGTAFAVGTSSVCGGKQVSNADPVSDPYLDLDDNIPANPCGAAASNYPTATKSGNSYTSSKAANRWPLGLSSPSYTGANGEKIFCGDVALTGMVTTQANNSTIIIYNGSLITNGFTFTGDGSSLIFAGENNANYTHSPTDSLGNNNVTGSKIDITAPTTGPWKGVAIYQDPDLTQNVDIDQSGNSPAFVITGLVYSPNGDVEFSGVINKYGSGHNCFILVGNTINIDGTGQIYANATSDCESLYSGFEVPQLGPQGRPWLVY